MNPTERTWSTYQSAVFAEVETGTGNAIVSAVAGSGKTTTIVEALKRVPAGQSVLMMAFNKAIQTTLAARAPEGVEVKTCHSHGFASVRRKFRNVKVNNRRSQEICERLFGDRRETKLNFNAVGDLVRVAKDTLIAFGDHQAFDSAADTYGVDVPEDLDARETFIKAAVKVHQESRKVSSDVDFADMCWLPVVLNLPVYAFDVVFVDETQDLCPSQIELLVKSVRVGGRVIAVGDPCQAIYAFRGADVSTMPRLIERLSAKVLPLSVTYRCPRAVVAMAKRVVPHLEAAPDAAMGVVRNDSFDGLLGQAKAGDMVVSRTNAPLLPLCLKFLASGRKASIKGRDIGEGLVRLIEKSKAQTLEGLETWLGMWASKEERRLAKKERSADHVYDQVACIMALADGAADVLEVKARAVRLFTDSNETGITLGTTHKLKGLEADRVWMLEDTFRPSKGGEEANIWYVAVTRAHQELVMVPSAKDTSK